MRQIDLSPSISRHPRKRGPCSESHKNWGPCFTSPKNSEGPVKIFLPVTTCSYPSPTRAEPTSRARRESIESDLERPCGRRRPSWSRPPWRRPSRRPRRRASSSRRPWPCRAASPPPRRWQPPSASKLPRPDAARAWSVFAAASAALVGERELCVGAGLEPFKLAQRRRERCCLACRSRGSILRLVGRIGGFRRLTSERLGTRRSSRDGSGPRLSRRGVGGRRSQCGHRRERHNDGPPQRPFATVDCAVMSSLSKIRRSPLIALRVSKKTIARQRAQRLQLKSATPSP